MPTKGGRNVSIRYKRTKKVVLSLATVLIVGLGIRIPVPLFVKILNLNRRKSHENYIVSFDDHAALCLHG